MQVSSAVPEGKGASSASVEVLASIAAAHGNYHMYKTMHLYKDNYWDFKVLSLFHMIKYQFKGACFALSKGINDLTCLFKTTKVEAFFQMLYTLFYK